MSSRLNNSNKKFKFLLIEDNFVDAKIFKQSLVHTNIPSEKLFVAETLANGLSILENQIPDVIFLDLNLPDSLGINSFRLLKSVAIKIPVIILTGIDDESVAKEALREGAQDYLLKNQLASNLLSRSVLYAIERKRFENEMWDNKASNDALIENTTDGIWSVDKKFRFITINSSFRESFYSITGHAPVRGECLLDAIDSKNRDWFKDVANRAINGEQFTTEKTFNFGGKILDMELSVNPISGKSGNVEGISFFARNITNRKQLEEKLESARKELQTFIYKSSHDLKGPLSSILGLISLLEKETDINEISKFTDMIKTSAENLDEMLEQLLNVVRIRRDKADPVKIDFNEFLNTVFDGLKSTPDFDAVEKEISITNEVDFYTDKRLLYSILRNIIENAIKFSSGNLGRKVQIRISDHLSGVYITIEDNGFGIDPETRNNMFFMFYKGNNNPTGNGLGLYVVRNAIDRLGGFIEFKSEKGNYTRFEIYLPSLNIEEPKTTIQNSSSDIL